MTPRREKRKRGHITLSQKLASALADLLPVMEARELREQRVPADDVIRRFTPDHVDLHALGGSDDWWNFRMTRRGPELKAKDAKDTSRVAKHDRLQKDRERHEAVMRDKLLGPSAFADMPERSIPRSRWPQGRKLQSRSTFQRRER